MIDLLKAMERSRRLEPERIEPRFSRKTKHVTVTVYIDKVPVEASVSIKRLDRVIDRVCNFDDGDGEPDDAPKWPAKTVLFPHGDQRKAN
jgi:hypothetical protein